MNKLRVLQSLVRMMHTTNNVIITEKINHVTTIGINRPDKRNCIDFRTAKSLKIAIEEFERDDNAYAAVIHGTGGNFCSGFDLNELADLERDPSSYDSLQNGLLGLPNYVKKPTVAAINGYAVAGGLELALLCDLRVVEDTAVLGLYERRFGIPISDGATVRLQAMIGLSRALDMILTGRSLNANEAFEWGLANRIVACGTALGQAINLATSLVKFPQDCLNIDRRSTYNAAYNKIFDDLIKEERSNSKNVSIAHIIEGAKKFIAGLGRHGKSYHLTEKDICDWEKEFRLASENNPKSKL
ncbi:unnamed protein product [Phyllotreta striolata]|uniref:Enoyl-CoA hydratase n=1 Tax=Phyllotreta striolata TaxID=444603 RepID=A0A9N9XPH4_PHYSR|nr:unnamed protein product [Phyllotreta striolata]